MGVTFERPGWLSLFLLLPLAAAIAWRHWGRVRRGRHLLALAARLLLLSGLILALAGAQGVRHNDDLTVVFLLDRSASVPTDAQEAAEAWVRQALSTMPAGDRAAIVAFGQDALVERAPSADRRLDRMASVPLPEGSDLAGAIRLGLALLPGDTAGRLVLLSDGQETTGDARSAARLAAARGVALDVVPIGHPPAGGEVRLAEIAAPATVRQGQRFTIDIVVESTRSTEAILEVFSGGAVRERRSVTLSPGTNRFSLLLRAEEPGFQRHQAYIRPLHDTWPQNNQGAGFTNVLGPPRLLLVEGAAGEAVELALALRAAGLSAEVVPPARLPVTPQALAAYDIVFLIDTPARDLPPGTMPLLQSYVRDLGRGLAMVGGPASFGRGGYLRTPVEEALPVALRPRDRAQRPDLALVLVLDRSGSMGSGGIGSDPSKLELAVEAAAQTASTLEEGDMLGIVAFDTTARWVVPLDAVDATETGRALAGLDPGGGTSIYAGLVAAGDAILEVDAPLRHLILLSDGWSEGEGYAALVEELAADGVTTSIVAIGEEPAGYLQELAARGGGRYFWVRRPEEIPQILLEETMTAMGAYIVEETFLPTPGDGSPILADLAPAALPPLHGYNGTWPKAAAQVPLYTHRQDPLLAHWNYGLGRAAAWTSDLKGDWAADWIAWEEFPRFAAQLAGWLLPLPEEGNLQVETTLQERHLDLAVTGRDAQDRPLDFLSGEAHLLGPNLEVLTATLTQVAPGRYRAEADLPATGAYLMQIDMAAPDGSIYRRQGGVVVSYSAEYRAVAPDLDLTRELARVGGGVVGRAPEEAFAHTLPPARTVRDWAPALLLIALLLLPLDVATRRLRLAWGEMGAFLRQFPDAVRRRLAPAPREVAPGEEATLPASLLRSVRQARQARRERRPRPQAERPASPPATVARSGGRVSRRGEAPPDQEEPAPASTPTETLSRLREAKERARREKEP